MSSFGSPIMRAPDGEHLLLSTAHGVGMLMLSFFYNRGRVRKPVGVF